MPDLETSRPASRRAATAPQSRLDRPNIQWQGSRSSNAREAVRPMPTCPAGLEEQKIREACWRTSLKRLRGCKCPDGAPLVLSSLSLRWGSTGLSGLVAAGNQLLPLLGG